MSDIEKLLDIMGQLRDPDHGCPWDLQQDFSSIAPYTIEEAYEVDDAIRRNHLNDLKDELGDLLFQVVFHARLGSEAGAFDFGDVVAAICDKLTRRHPHIFASAQITDAAEQTAAWEEHKAREREQGGSPSVLADIPLSLPALSRAQKLGKRAARVGFDWPDLHGPREKIGEELEELDRELTSGDLARQQEELGDLLFSAVNLARHLGFEAETALRDANQRFQKRFEALESLADAEALSECDLEQLEALWQRAKASA